jgi:hypothetical protein
VFELLASALDESLGSKAERRRGAGSNRDRLKALWLVGKHTVELFAAPYYVAPEYYYRVQLSYGDEHRADPKRFSW